MQVGAAVACAEVTSYLHILLPGFLAQVASLDCSNPPPAYIPYEMKIRAHIIHAFILYGIDNDVHYGIQMHAYG